MVTGMVTVMAMATVPKVLEVAVCAAGGAAFSPVPVSSHWSSPARRSRRRRPLRRHARVAWALIALALPAQAENWAITPSIAVGGTLTNNLYLTATNRTSDLVTSVTPGISIDGKGARASLRLGYTITQNIYARESSENNLQQALLATGTLEALEDWLFVDASATISQQNISAFGAVAPSDVNITRNRTETFYYSLSPYVRGRLLSSADYLLRYTVSGTNPDSSVVSNMTMSQWLGRINGNTRWSALSWSIDYSSNSANYDVGRDRDDTRYGVTLAYRFNPQLQVSAIFGRERTNLVSLQNETNNDSGFGLLWTPSPRTKLDGRVTRRFFGDGYNVAFSHRRPLSAFSYTASRDVSYQPAGVTNTGQGSNFDAFYGIVAANNPGLSPEAIRAQVNQILLGRGVPADGSPVNGYLTNRPNLQTSQQISYALLGVRNTLTFNASESQQQPLGVISGLTDDYSLANEVTQRGYGVIWGHQLTGLSSLSLSLNQQRSLANGRGAVDSKTTGAYLLFTTSLGPRTSANVGARHVISDGGVNADYTESALTASLSHSF